MLGGLSPTGHLPTIGTCSEPYIIFVSYSKAEIERKKKEKRKTFNSALITFF